MSMFLVSKGLRRYFYRFLPAGHGAFYPARRRGLNYMATQEGRRPVGQTQRDFLWQWVGVKEGTFVEWDAGDGVVGSHALWLEERGWRGWVREDRKAAAALLKKNRPQSQVCPPMAAPGTDQGEDLVTARRAKSIARLVEGISQGYRPRWVILQARDPQPEIFRAMNRSGYRLDQFIHDDEYYRHEGI